MCLEFPHFAKPQTVVGNALTNDMKLKLSILTLLTLSVLQVHGQVVKKCDDKILLGASKKIGTLNQKEISDFLLTFGQECRDNAEFSEWSNELLFKILDKQTELTLTTIEKEQKIIEIKTILDDLSEPITDNVNIKSLISKIERVTFDDKLKNKIITSLKLADDKD